MSETEIKVVTISVDSLEIILRKMIEPINEELKALRTDSDIRMYTLREAHKITGIPYKTLLSACKEGKLKALHENNAFRVTKSNIIDYINHH